MVYRVLHHLKTMGNLIVQRQVQDDRRYEASIHDRAFSFADDDNGVGWVVEELVDDHNDQRHLKNVGDRRVQEKVDSFGVLDLQAALELDHILAFLIHVSPVVHLKFLRSLIFFVGILNRI
jgi:hypothetical protein